MSMTHCNQATLKGTISQIFPKEKVVNLTIMTVKEYYTKEEEKKTIFSYVPCVAFGHEANIAKSMEKGDLVTIIASIGTNTYEKEGKKIYTVQVLIESIALNKKASGEKTTTKGSFNEEVSIDEVPF